MDKRMNIALEQFVPSHVCLKCEGCCRYASEDSLWRPKWDKKEFVDDQDYVTTIQDCGKHLCRFLNKGDNTCLVYSARPFECALYPFILSKKGKTIEVYVHLACPYVQDNQANPALDQYITYLRDFFKTPETIAFLKRQRHLIHDYASVMVELQHVFTIPEPL